MAVGALIVEGERIALGPLRRDLAATYEAWDSDLDLSVLRGQSLLVTPLDGGARWFNTLPTDGSAVFFTLYETVFEHREPRPVGVSMLLRIDRAHRTAELGIYLGERDAWNNGLGTEAVRLTLDYAFSALGLGNVLLRVIAANTRAARAYERAGFKVMGRQRGSYRVGGVAYDEVYMDCIPEEFESPVLRARIAAALG